MSLEDLFAEALPIVIALWFVLLPLYFFSLIRENKRIAKMRKFAEFLDE